MERQLDDTRQRLQGLNQELKAYDKIMSLLSDHINENLEIQKRLATNNEDERKRNIVKESYDKLIAKHDRFRVSKMDREDDYKRLISQKNQLESTLKKLQEAQELQSENIRHKSNQLQPQRPDPAFDYDVETINFLNECNWNLDSCDRPLAEQLLSCFPDGTFLVRPSKSAPDSYVLSVVVDSKVRHCLINRVGEEFCFSPPGPMHQFYPSLCSLVMDYRHKSLVCHNPELDTNLIYPVFSQLKKHSRK